MASSAGSTLVREYAVAVFVAHEGAVLLHFHGKLGRWLPPGGHVEPNELPDEAARRETLEETGIIVDLIDASNPLFIDVPRPVGVPPRLVQPIGIQLEAIPARGSNPDHEHIDLVYAARVAPGSMADPRADSDDPEARPGWFKPEEWGNLGLTAEVIAWAKAALALVDKAR